MFTCKVGKNKKSLLSVKITVCGLADMLTISTTSKTLNLKSVQRKTIKNNYC